MISREVQSLESIPQVRTDLTKSSYKFSDVKGADEAKQELKNIVEFLKNPEKFTKLGGKLPKGILLVGPPGTGKTLLAKAIAGEAGVPFYNKSGAEFDEMFVGLGAKRIRDLFRLAKKNTPCVIFIDEIDSIGKQRTSSDMHPHANDTINQLLIEMDGFKSNSGIVVLGATNRRGDLDTALLRPGRFDVEVNVSVPDYTGRTELLNHYLGQVPHGDIDLGKIARVTTNLTGADIESMVNQAALRAAVLGTELVTAEHIEYAIDKALMGPEKLSKILDEETNKITAYHEGGHTVVAYFTEHAQPLHKVSIIARGSSLGHTSFIPSKDDYHVTKTQLLAMIDTMMGGRAAEELIFGTEKVTSGASSDLEKSTDLASKMVQKWGMSDEVGLSSYSNRTLMSPQTANLIDAEVNKILKESYKRAKNILIAHKDKLRELSEALLKYETLDAEEISSIMEGKTIRKPQELAGDDKVSVTAEDDDYVLTTTGDYQNVGTIADDNDDLSITVEDIQDFTRSQETLMMSTQLQEVIRILLQSGEMISMSTHLKVIRIWPPSRETTMMFPIPLSCTKDLAQPQKTDYVSVTEED
ncbi:ATP-dependent zinc metalloprotease YME1L-like [Macrosteles quadrilineatus]|uniref:ATP-dependent zinc metalloprotease YME1L-like n=1 Tax=Macrosteles quadrilineatus TaxID=74068 RepID=UPI0023E2EF21|nr:ATP-dependent zinc metalloprotease YME1L-like [Macrosteles quadrilineatus]